MSQLHRVAGRVRSGRVRSRRRGATIFLVCLLLLFLNLFLIRWIGTEARIFAHLQSVLLTVCLLGLAMGCLSCRKPFVLRELLLPLFFLVLLLSVAESRQSLRRISELLGVLGDVGAWGAALNTSPLESLSFAGLGLALAFLLMGLLWCVFVPLGRLLGRFFADHPRPLRACVASVAGSGLGLGLFVLLGALSQPPVVWCIAAGFLLLFFFPRRGPRRLVDLPLLAGTVGVSWLAGEEAVVVATPWVPVFPPQGPPAPLLYFVLVGMLPLLFYVGYRRIEAPEMISRWGRSHWHFFCLGGGFLLLEVQTIWRTSAVVGSTMWAGALVLSGTLALVLLATLLAMRFSRIRPGPICATLCTACLVLYVLELTLSAQLSPAVAAVLETGLGTLAVSLGGLLFVRSLAATAERDLAVGANLIGLLAGGLLCAVAPLVEVGALLPIGAGFYLVALWVRPRAVRAAPVVEKSIRERKAEGQPCLGIR